MLRHAKDRLYVGPNTNELIIYISRAYDVEPSDLSNIRIEFTRRSKRKDVVVSTWVPYAVKKEDVHFQPPDEFMSNVEDFPKGFYDGVIYLHDCPISEIELVKAPGHFVKTVKTVQDSCSENSTWVEPGCEIEEPTSCSCECNGSTQVGCSCTYQNKESCPTCFNEVHVAKVNIKEGYVDWESENVDGGCEGVVMTPSATDETNEPECESTIQTGPLDVTKKSNLKEGYVDDVDC